MIVCTRCGASNQPTSKFCLSCGAPLAAAPPGAGAPPPGPPAPAPQHYAPPPAQPAPAPQWGAPPPQPHYAPPPEQPQQPPPQQWGGYQQPPAAPAWGPPPPQQAFAPAEPPRYQAGSPEGLNPFGATVGPPQGYGAPPAGPSPYGPPPQWGPPPEPAPPQQQWGAPPPAQPQPAPQAAPTGPHSRDPSAYAATAPPPTGEEFERASAQAAPPMAPAPAPAPAPFPSAPPAAVAPDTSGLRVLAGFLVSYEATELGLFWPIYQGQNVVGRKGAAPGLDIEIDHPTTSSRHAILHATARPGRLRIEDPGSTNGTFLGDQMLDKNKQHDLRDGDALRFGGFNVIVKVI